ncbi:MAG TPA: hypothetical protein VEJ19_06030 [Nitrososphaerales archaeon]|nr:hypothetical protein [Nitrososphaerales archaeon]
MHQLQLGGKYYLLLPKLNSVQIEILARRLSEVGVVRRGAALVATSREGTIRVSDEGLCWSSFDPSDAVLPAVPALLSFPKEEAPMETIKGKYLRASGSKGKVNVCILPRLETSSWWRELRASGGCALAPDEHAVVSFLLERVRGNCEMITDFLVDGCNPIVLGRKRYFDSKVSSGEAVSTLRVVGERSQRNSYIPGDGNFRISWISAVTERDWTDLFAYMGEWCSFTPV